MCARRRSNLSLASPRTSHQREGDPAVRVPCAALRGRGHGQRGWGPCVDAVGSWFCSLWSGEHSSGLRLRKTLPFASPATCKNAVAVLEHQPPRQRFSSMLALRLSEGLGRALRLFKVVRVDSLHHVRCCRGDAHVKVNHQPSKLLSVDEYDLRVNPSGVVSGFRRVA